MLKHGILGLLNYGSMTGYEIMLTFKNSLCYFWTAQTSQIYRELQTLKKNGWAADKSIPQQGKPDKVYFSITDDGRKELKRWLAEEDTGFDVRSTILMKTFFRGECSIDDSIEHFRRLHDTASEFSSGMDMPTVMIERYKQAVSDPKKKALFWYMTLDFGRLYGEMLKKWTENCIAALEEYKDENTDN